MGEGTTSGSSGCGVWEALKCGGKSRRRGAKGKRVKKGEVEPEEENSGGEVKSEYVWETVGDARRRNGILKKSDVGEESRDEDGVIKEEGDDVKKEDGQEELVNETYEKEKDINDIKSLDNHGELILKIYVLLILQINKFTNFHENSILQRKNKLSRLYVFIILNVAYDGTGSEKVNI